MTKSKYNNRKVEFEGIQFDSAMELKYYKYLLQLQAEGVVSEILMQKTYIIFDGYTKDGRKVLPIKYIADFEVHYADGTIEVVDVKGMETKDFKIKKKLFEHRYPFELKLVTHSLIDGGWITLEELRKARAKRRRAKKDKTG